METETMIRSFWVNLTGNGTAMGETALCNDCQHEGTNSLDCTRLAMLQADFSGQTARMRVQNEALTCQACGIASCDEWQEQMS